MREVKKKKGILDDNNDNNGDNKSDSGTTIYKKEIEVLDP